MCDQCLDFQPATQRQAHAVVPPLAAQAADLALQLVAGTGAQHQAPKQVKVAGIFGSLKNLGLQGL
ncbi:hypothetical protein D3C76_1618510 [compost metagenome]